MKELKALGVASASLALCFTALVIAGCKADAGKNTGYTNSSVMTKDPSLPFQKSWVKPGFDKSRYSKLYVAPVNTEYMLKLTEWEKGERRDQIEADTAKLALYAQDAVKKAFREDSHQRMQIVDSPTGDAGTLILEMAITEVIPSKVTLNALGYAPFGIGMGVTAARMVAKDTSTVAMEARIRDAKTNEVVAMVSDREAEQLAAVSVRGLTWYSHAESIISQWSGQLVKVANRKPGETVKDTEVFTLQPW